MKYMDLTQQNSNFRLDSHPLRIDTAAIDATFAAAILPQANVRQAGVDLFNNPLVPDLSLLTQNASSDGWYNAGSAAASGNAASLYGVALTKNPAGTDTLVNNTATFSMNTSYFTYSCIAPVRKTWTEVNATGVNLVASKSQTLFMAMDPPYDHNATGLPDGIGTGNLTLVSSAPPADGDNTTDSVVNYATCSMTQTFLEATLFCTTARCTVQKVRPRTDIRVRAILDFTTYFVDATSSTAMQGIPTPTMIEAYLSDPNSVLLGPTSVDLATVNQTAFERRLSLLLNTYWHLGFGPMYQTGLVSDREVNIPMTNVTATLITPMPDAYALNIPWLVTFFVCTTILVLAALANARWEHHTVGPDILGFASSIVRQSKYVAVEKGPSTESGAERAKRLREHKVMMQDVKPNAAVGKIALGTCMETTVPLKPTKLYR